MATVMKIDHRPRARMDDINSTVKEKTLWEVNTNSGGNWSVFKNKSNCPMTMQFDKSRKGITLMAPVKGSIPFDVNENGQIVCRMLDFNNAKSNAQLQIDIPETCRRFQNMKFGY